MGEKLLRAMCISTKIKLQIIASLLYKISAHFGIAIKIKLQIIASLLYKINAHFGQYFGNLSQKVGKDRKKKIFVANPN